MNNKIRVYELAKMLGKSNKDLMKVLQDLGVEVKTHMSSIDGETAQLVEDALSSPEAGAASGAGAAPGRRRSRWGTRPRSRRPRRRSGCPARRP